MYVIQQIWSDRWVKAVTWHLTGLSSSRLVSFPGLVSRLVSSFVFTKKCFPSTLQCKANWRRRRAVKIISSKKDLLLFLLWFWDLKLVREISRGSVSQLRYKSAVMTLHHWEAIYIPIQTNCYGNETPDERCVLSRSTTWMIRAVNHFSLHYNQDTYNWNEFKTMRQTKIIFLILLSRDMQGVYWKIWSLKIVSFNIIPVSSEYGAMKIDLITKREYRYTI